MAGCLSSGVRDPAADTRYTPPLAGELYNTVAPKRHDPYAELSGFHGLSRADGTGLWGRLDGQGRHLPNQKSPVP